MKKFFSFLCVITSFSFAFAQPKSPVSFNFEAKKKSVGFYEIVITSTVQAPWHIYSQNTDKGGPIPTKISFKPNPLIKLESKIQEVGKLQKIFDKTFGVNVMYYSNSVKFIQIAKVKSGIKTNISGTIEYMVCDDKECLPPKKQNFELTLQ